MPEHNNLLDSDWAAQFSDVPGAAIARQPESDAGEIQYDDLPESDLLDSDWAAQFAEPTEQTAYHRAGQTAAEWRSLWDPTGDWLSSLDEGEAERGLIPGFYGSTARGMGQMVGDIASAVEAAGGSILLAPLGCRLTSAVVSSLLGLLSRAGEPRIG